MAKQLFKGFKQVSGVTSTSILENGYIYLVRDDETKEHGYIYFNGKKYGTTKEVADDMAALESGLSAERAARELAISGLQDELATQVSALTDEVTAREEAISGVQGQLSGVQSNLQTQISGVQSRIDNLDATLSDSSNGVQVEITQTDGKLTGLTVTAPEAAQHTSQDKSIKITTGTQGIDFGLNRETATDNTVAAGHLEIALNASGETYAVMYYDGNDTQDTNS